MKTKILIVLLFIFISGCNKSNEKLSVDERWQLYEKDNGKTPEIILVSANKIKKFLNYTEEEIWVISKAFCEFFIGIKCEFNMPEKNGSSWQTKITFGGGLGGSSRLQVNDKSGVISYEGRELGNWQELTKFVNTNGFGNFNSPKEQKLSILDSFKSKRYSNLILEAEQELPDDVWKESPRGGKFNDSKSKRMFTATSHFLNEIKPKIETMKAIELIESLKSEEKVDHSGVGYFIYRDGNEMLIQELRNRPQKELLELRPFYMSNISIWTGDSGPSLWIKDVIDICILKLTFNKE